jgi:glutamyl-tRNA synthetase
MLRFAPSPTGDLHIGNLRIALINHLVARQRGEELLVRIEDTDRERNIEGKDREIVELLRLFGVKFNRVLYQSQNFPFHRQLAYRLVEEGKAFPCFCSEDQIAIEREKARLEKRPYRYSGRCEQLTKEEVKKMLEKGVPYTIRIKKPTGPIEFTDLVKGELRFDPFEVDSFIILRRDGTPTYNFACAVDDMLGDISLVIRGEDHLSNTPKQIHIRQMLGYTKPIQYAHIPIILNSEGKKLSKRERSSSVKWLLEEGFLPEAIANYLIVLGNTLPKELFDLEEAVHLFRLEKISKAPARFDMEKLKFINRYHLQKLAERERLTSILKLPEELEGLARLYVGEVSTLKELKERLLNLYNRPDYGELEEEALLLKGEILKMVQELGGLPEEYNRFKKLLMERTGLKGKRFFMPLRLLLIGTPHGPEIKDLYAALFPIIPKLLEEYR